VLLVKEEGLIEIGRCYGKEINVGKPKVKTV
jgi:hypothetical protein